MSRPAIIFTSPIRRFFSTIGFFVFAKILARQNDKKDNLYAIRAGFSIMAHSRVAVPEAVNTKSEIDKHPRVSSLIIDGETGDFFNIPL